VAHPQNISIPHFRTFPRWKGPLVTAGPPIPEEYTREAVIAYEERRKVGATKENERRVCKDPDVALLALRQGTVFDAELIQEAVLRKPLNAIALAKRHIWANRRHCAETAGVQAELAWNFHKEVVSVDPHTNAQTFGLIPHYAWRAYMELPLEPTDVEHLKLVAATHALYAPLVLPAKERLAYIQDHRDDSREYQLAFAFLHCHLAGINGIPTDSLELIKILNSDTNPLNENEKEILLWILLAKTNQEEWETSQPESFKAYFHKEPQWFYHLARYSHNETLRNTFLEELLACPNCIPWVLQLGHDAAWIDIDKVSHFIASKSEPVTTTVEVNKWKLATRMRRAKEEEDMQQPQQRETSINEEMSDLTAATRF
jgi:hypothetical protein